VNWKGPEEIQFFSNDGMSASSKANFAFIYQKNNGKTHIISTSEKLMVQNITKKSPVEINKGEFTYVMPEKNPAEPALITTEVTDLMRKFFGDKFVNKELEQANIKVATTTTKAVAEKAETKQKFDESIRLTPLFSMGKILKKIRQIEGIGKNRYIAPYWVDEMLNHKYYLETKFSYISASPQGQSASFNGAKIRTGANFGNVAIGINLPFETNNKGDYSMALTGKQGILDKIYYLDYVTPKQQLSIHFGEIRNLTYHNGLLVNNFSNEIRSQIAQPLGMIVSWEPSYITSWNYFIADMSSFQVMGTNFLFENGYTSLGNSIFIDFDQSGGLTTGDGEGNFRGETVLDTDTSSESGTVWGWDVFVDFNFIQQEKLIIFGYAGFGKIFKNGFDGEGFIIQFPGMEIFYGKYRFFFEGLVSNQSAHPGYFNSFYLEDRSRIAQISTSQGSSMAVAQVDRNPYLGSSNGMKTGFDMRILKNLWAGLTYGQTMFTTGFDPAKIASSDAGTVTQRQGAILVHSSDYELYRKNSNRTMKFRIFGGNNIVSGLKRFEVYYDIEQASFGRLISDTVKVIIRGSTTVSLSTEISDRMTVIDTIFTSTGEPDSLMLEFDYNNDYPLLTGTQSESTFFSLNALFGVKIEYAVLSNATVLAEFRGFSHDFAGNGIFDEGDIVSEFVLTWRQKF